MEALIKAGGIYNIVLVVFHMLFWHIFNWGEDLGAFGHTPSGPDAY